MTHPEFLYPVVALALLTAMAMVMMLKERISEMKERRIHPQSAPSSSQMSNMMKNTKGADNYKNLFELPTLFYVLCVILMFATKALSPVLLGLAWIYVVLRYWHSYVHIGYNKVMTRFKIFLASAIVLFSMWTVAVWQLV